MRTATLLAMNAEILARRAAVLVTEIASGEQRLVLAANIADDPLAEALEANLRPGVSRMVEFAGKSLFLEVMIPSVRLVIIGAAHISQILAPIAQIAGFDVVIVDPRSAFASAERFPGVKVIADWPQDVLAAMKLDCYSGVILLTHDPRIDDQGLAAALKADCFYIGALGSAKTHLKRLERMRTAGFDETSLSRIHAPIGLDIGALTPPEIAISILAEIIAAQSRKPRRSAKTA